MSIFYAESIKSIFRTLGHHLHNLGGQVEQGLEGVHHVDGEVVQRIQRCSKCKCRKHYASSRKCPANVDLTDMIDDTSEDEIVEGTDDTANEETADEFS